MRIGSLFSGYGGLDHATEAAFGATTAWVSDIDKGACKILAHRYPNVPNLGDITGIDWATVEPVDIITGGSPCQDLSHAGKRQGMTDGTRSNLWVTMREAIAELRPKYVVWENVRGAYSAAADSAVVIGGRLLAPRDGGPTLRALGRVLGDLSDIGYDAQWCGLRAADVGAPHGRFRVFVVATNTDEQRPGVAFGAVGDKSFKERIHGHSFSDPLRIGPERSLTLLPTPEAKLGSSGPDYARMNRPGTGGDSLHEAIGRLLPTPACNDMGAGKTVDAWDAWTDRMKSEHGNGNGHGASLSIEALRLLPTPQADTSSTIQYSKPALEALTLDPSMFGQYAAAIARWEHVLGRPAPAPTEPTGRDGAHRLSARFVEFLMGLPDGWMVDVPGVTRNQALKALGNGVVPQQAYAAITHMLSMEAAA